MGLTNKQKQAIDFDQGKCLVAAGAGSGKTKVLTSRIFQLVAEGKAKLSELLVLTFTNKAAHEMKMRVRALFAEDPKFQSLLPEVESAKIMTFDAFALDLVKRYRYEFGLDKGINLLDKCFFDIKTEELLDEVLNEHYQKALAGNDPLFAKIAVKLSPYDDDNLKTYVKALLALADKKPDRRAFLEGGALATFEKSYVEAALLKIEEKKRADLRTYYEEMSLVDTEGRLEKEFAFIDTILATSGFDEFAAAYKGSWPRITKLDEDVKAYRNLMKDRYVKNDATFFSRSKQAWIDDYLSTKPYVEVCLLIASEVEKRLSAYKKEKGAYDFPDIALFAKQIVASPFGEKVKNQFRYVMVDEYQDTSDLQEDFINAMGVPNVFLVGDIKQSIYGFRNANPRLFAEKFEQYGKGIGGTLITLDDNFRSREQVLASINETFSSIMSEELGGIDYSKGQALNFGNHGYDATKGAAPYGPEVITYEKQKYKNDDHVALVLARDILAKIKNHYQVKDGDGTRDIRFGDFAILTRKGITLKRYEKVFRSMNIPIAVSADENAFDMDVMMVMSSLVEWLSLYEEEKPADSKILHHAVSLKRSFLLNKTDEAIYFETQQGLDRDYLVTKVHDFYLSHKDCPLPTLIQEAISAFDFPGALLRLGEVKANFDLLSYFVKLAENATRLGMGLKEFAAFLRRRKELSVELKVSSPLESSDAVSLMTIHKSKGLEFPFVYFPSLNAKFHTFKGDGASGFVSSLNHGPVMPIFDNPEGRNLFYELEKKESGLESKSEEMRILYVALTRTKEAYAVLLPTVGGEVIKPPSSIMKSQNHLGFLFFSSLLELPAVDGEGLPFAPVQLQNAVTQKEVALLDGPEVLAIEKEEEEKLPFSMPPSFGALRFGKRLHRYMEVVDLSTHDLSFIPSPHDRQIIEKVLNLPLFLAPNKTAFREFEFVGGDGKIGRIDLFFVYEDHIEVIDYKSLSIDDPKYKDQVKRYATHLNQVYGLPVTGYLLSLAEARLIKVE